MKVFVLTSGAERYMAPSTLLFRVAGHLLRCLTRKTLLRAKNMGLTSAYHPVISTYNIHEARSP